MVRQEATRKLGFTITPEEEQLRFSFIPKKKSLSEYIGDTYKYIYIYFFFIC
jgi:hypothetical protein